MSQNAVPQMLLITKLSLCEQTAQESKRNHFNLEGITLLLISFCSVRKTKQKKMNKKPTKQKTHTNSYCLETVFSQ